MRQILEDLQALQDDVVRGLAFDIRDEAETAGIVFMGWIVQALREWQLIVRIGQGHYASSFLQGEIGVV